MAPHDTPAASRRQAMKNDLLHLALMGVARDRRLCRDRVPGVGEVTPSVKG